MSKKLRDLKWESVALEGFPLNANDKFSGFVGLEECTEYGFDRDTKKPRKEKPQKKRKRAAEASLEHLNKKIRLSNGFIVENCNIATPSLTNEEVSIKSKVKRKENNKKKSINDNTAAVDDKSANTDKKQDTTKKTRTTNMKKKKVKLGEDISETVCETLTPEDMLTWAEFKLPEPILKALAELGYKRPTKIQQLSLPAAIHGRRDILGAAETGSGKTLAFGLPILTGILKIKEKAEAGYDVYEVPYKKTSRKKKVEEVERKPIIKRVNKKNIRNIKQEANAKESSEDGYSSGEDSDVGSEDNNETIKKEVQSKTANNSEKEDIQEYEVPVKKRESSVDEGNSSDDDDGYIHLSELSISEDLSDSSDTETGDDSVHKSKNNHEETNSKSEEGISDNEGSNSEESDGDSDDDENAVEKEENGDEGSEAEEMNEEEIDENLQGIGCVKVVDNIEMPGHEVIKTGKPLYALILTPTRELAVQISGHLKAVAKYTGIKIATIVGGMAAVKQERLLRGSPEIVVATPGRLWELMRQGHQHLQQVDTLRFLAIDETDRMIERNHFEELWPLLERLNADEARRAARQNFVFSATLTLVHDLPSHMTVKKVTKRGKILNRKIHKMTPQQKINKLIAMFGMTEPKVVDITQENLGTAETLTESRITCSFDQKDSYLYYILKRHPGRTIVFCNSISSVKRLSQLLGILNCRPLPLHASMQQKHRLKNLEKFRDNPNGLLVATDVAARGLDIPDVDHVIHYQVPKTAENYVHRSGRTARATKEGLTILMMEPSEAYHYTKLCRTLNKTSEVAQFPIPSTLLSPLKDIVSVARDIDALESKKRKAAQAIGWKEKAARDMDMILDDDDVPTTPLDSSINRALKLKRKQLNALMSRPLFPRGFSFKYPTLNDPNALVWKDENALQVMKKSLETGELKKEKRKGKNESLLKLEKTMKKK